MDGFRVRRLLPVECERLMGFKDGHTIPEGLEPTRDNVEYFMKVFDSWNEINWDGKGKKPNPTSKSKVEKWIRTISTPDTCPDSPRYKACGNSMCLNCMEWIGRRIQMVDETIDK